MNNSNGHNFLWSRSVRLEEVVIPFTGFWGSDSPSSKRQGFIVLGVGNVTNEGELDLRGAAKRYLSPEERGGVADEGDLIVVKSSGSAANIRSGKTAICPPELSGKIACSNFMMRLKVKRDVANPYLLWLILNSQAAKKFIRDIVGASTYPNIKWENYRRFEFELPPLEEQQRIAARLRERLSILTLARAALEAQLAAAESLPAAHLRAVFESEQAQRWPRVALGQICFDGGQYGTSQKSSTLADGVPVLRMGNISEGKILWDNLKYADRSNPDCIKYLLKPGDLLFNRTNSVELVGKSAVFEGGREAIFASYLIRFRIFSDRANPHFVCAFINSAQGRRFIDANMVRAIGQANVSASTMQRMEIPIPPIADQNVIAERLQHAYAQTRTLQQTIAAKLSELEKLPAALLHSAFNPNGD